MRTLIAVCALLSAPLLHAQDVAVGGAVAKPFTLDSGALDALGRQVRLAKVFTADDRYSGAYELSGAPLAAVLARAVVAKKTDDGFPRELDTYVVATGAGGRRVALSWGEVAMADDGGAFLVADRLRHLLPHHHDEASLARWDRGLLAPARRRGLDLASCAACHAGPQPPALVVPQGNVLFPARDRRADRFLSEVSRLDVCQAGPLSGVAGKKGEGAFVDAPTIVLPDGRAVSVTPKLVEGLPPVTWADATFGAGRGFHGDHAWSGVGLGAVLARAAGRPLDMRRLLVLVSAVDGYRSVYSGGEVALSALGEGLILADQEDGKPFGPKDGRYRLVPRLDFYVDRSVRLVKEIRVLEVPETGAACVAPPASPAR